MPRKPSVPSYRLHKPSGLAVVTICGRDYYLGPHNTPESLSAYQRLIAEWTAHGFTMPVEAAPDLTVNEVLNGYWKFAETYYVRADHVSGETVPAAAQLYHIKKALTPVADLYGSTPAAKFGPVALRACREVLIKHGYARKYVNSLVGCIKRLWKWAAAEELVPPAVWHGLGAVEGLKLGRTTAKENAPVKPVPEADIRVVQEGVYPQVRDLIELQLLTGMRPGEAVLLRPCDLDRVGLVWLYRPRCHKTQHLNKERLVFLGPQAQKVLSPYLEREPERVCFSSREAQLNYLAAKERKQRVRSRQDDGEHYTTDTYSTAIHRACVRLGVTPWHPHQLRHNAATTLVATYGWDLARIVLGHSTLSATRIYGEDAVRKAVEAMKEFG